MTLTMNTNDFPRVLRTMQCRRPRYGEWFRVRPGDDWQSEAAIFRDAVRHARYLVSEYLWPELRPRISRVTIRSCVSWTGEPFLWAIPYIDDDSMNGGWADSARECAEAAEQDWCLLAPAVCLDRFAMWTAGGRAPEPQWTDTPLWKLVAFAFRDRVIESCDHPALRREPKW